MVEIWLAHVQSCQLVDGLVEFKDMLVSQLQSRIKTSDLSVYRIARLSQVDLAQLSKFQHYGRGLSLASAGRVCAVLGLQLTTTNGQAAAAEINNPKDRLERASLLAKKDVE